MPKIAADGYVRETGDDAQHETPTPAYQPPPMPFPQPVSDVDDSDTPF
jgi:hypothetical protein